VLIACWSTKGGVGTTVVATTIAILLAGARGGALLVDLAGDVPLALGLGALTEAPGVADWLAAAPDVPPDALVRLEASAGPRLSVIPRGDGLLRAGPGADALAALLVDDPRPVVVDCGRTDAPAAGADVALTLAAGATRSLLVVRPCAMTLHRAQKASVQPSGLVLVDEPGRTFTPKDVEAAVGAPVLARVRTTDAVARTVDAGLLGDHVPRTLARDLHHLAS
jgi:hypothetical protein